MTLLAQQASRFPEIEPLSPETSSLDERDAAFAHALYDASIRRWLTLEYIIQDGMNRPFRELEAGVKAALIAGSAQLLLMDRVPAHAAVDQSVDWASRTIRPGAGKLVNAVLRRVSEKAGEHKSLWKGDRRSIPLATGSRDLIKIKLPEGEGDHLSIATSVPRMLIDRWSEHLEPEAIREVCLHALSNPPTILNIEHAESPVDASSTRSHETTDHVLWEGPRAELGTLLATRNDVWAQDPSSAEALRSIRDLSPKTIVDYCAGQGTKTRQLRAMFPEARIYATDVDSERYKTLAAFFEGDERVRVFPMAELMQRARGSADLVLLDVPCSNTGVMGRRVEARYRATPAALRRLRALQRQIIEQALALRSREGKILYATCSIDRVENHDQAAWASKAFGLRVERERATLPRRPGGPETSVDGSYSVLLTPGSPGE